LDEQETLAVIRTLLAYERNYQAIERTQLAQLRTGLSLVLITPAGAATLAYLFEVLPQNFAASVVVFFFLALIVIYGVWMAVNSFIGLRKTRQVQKKILQRQKEVIEQSNVAKEFLEGLR